MLLVIQTKARSASELNAVKMPKAGAPTVTSDSREVVDPAAPSGFSPFALSVVEELPVEESLVYSQCSSIGWRRERSEGQRGQQPQRRAPHPADPADPAVALTVARPLLSCSLSACLLTNSQIISQQQFGNPLSPCPGKTGEQTVKKSMSVCMFDFDLLAVWQEFHTSNNINNDRNNNNTYIN